MKRSGTRHFSGHMFPRGPWAGAALVAAIAAAGQAAAQDLVDALAAAPDIPNIAGLAFGSAPQYIGADDRMAGAVPLLRLQRAGSLQSVSLLGTVFTSNILNHPVLKTGPTGVFRLGRSDVDDDVVADLPEIDASLDLGWTVGAEFVDPDNSARRVRADFSFRHDVTGAHDGYVLGASASGWTPTPFFLLGGFASVTWGSDAYMDTYFGVEPSGSAASGLPAFNAQAGARDVAAGLVAIIPVNDRMLAGAGVLYSRLLNDAADSPIVDLRGERDQLLYGIGVAWAF
jgi:outer membrane protein